MAKLKAPLLSLGASGAIGEALVFFPWKGLDVVREYVVPANPKTDAQKLQRKYLREAVEAIHAAQALAAYPLSQTDTMAYSLWASALGIVMTWFNMACRNWINCYVAGNEGTIFRAGGAVEGDTTLLPTVWSTKIDGAKITAGRFFWGISRTALVHSGLAQINPEAHSANILIENLENGTKYFWQFRVDDGETCEGARSGIYHNTPVAP